MPTRVGLRCPGDGLGGGLGAVGRPRAPQNCLGRHAVPLLAGPDARPPDRALTADMADAGHNLRMSRLRGAPRGGPGWRLLGMTIVDRFVRAPMRRLKHDGKRSATNDGDALAD